ncbi:hypothetical protein ENBRE01_1299 [Enteropsectra breve]|nr:hypothetical protein ENBRE01_1299 [Enteropsectra breve]
MQEIYTKAGVSAKANAICVHGEHIYYLSQSNIVKMSSKCENVIFLESNANAIDSLDAQILAADVDGNGYLIENDRIQKIIRMNSTIQHCKILTSNLFAFSSLNKLFVYDLQTEKVSENKMPYLISSMHILDEILFVGSSVGSLYSYKIENNINEELKVLLLEKIEAHTNGITDIKITYIDGRAKMATCSLDTNIKV